MNKNTRRWFTVKQHQGWSNSKQENETRPGTERKVRDFLCDYLNITNIVIERAHRVSRKAGSETSNNKRKTVITKLLCYNDKDEILRTASNLKYKTYSVYEDFSCETQ